MRSDRPNCVKKMSRCALTLELLEKQTTFRVDRQVLSDGRASSLKLTADCRCPLRAVPQRRAMKQKSLPRPKVQSQSIE